MLNLDRLVLSRNFTEGFILVEYGPSVSKEPYAITTVFPDGSSTKYLTGQEGIQNFLRDVEAYMKDNYQCEIVWHWHPKGFISQYLFLTHPSKEK